MSQTTCQVIPETIETTAPSFVKFSVGEGQWFIQVPTTDFGAPVVEENIINFHPLAIYPYTEQNTAYISQYFFVGPKDVFIPEVGGQPGVAQILLHNTETGSSYLYTVKVGNGYGALSSLVSK